MATNGTPYEGVDNILLNAYTGLEIILYTKSGNSLDRTTVYADLVEPSNVDSETDPNGYATITLTGTWSSVDGIISYDHPGNPTFTNDAPDDNWDTVTGAAITDGTYVLHFKDFGTPVTLTPGGELQIDLSALIS
jgi:hypothetical protein